MKKVVWLVAFAVICSVSLASPDRYYDENPHGYDAFWPFDGDSFDIIQANHSNVSRCDGYVDSAPSNMGGQSLYCDGTNGHYVNTTWGKDELTLEDTWMFTAWVKCSAAEPTNGAYYLSSYNGGSAGKILLQYVSNPAQGYWLTLNDAVTTDRITGDSAGDLNLHSGNWEFLAVIVNVSDNPTNGYWVYHDMGLQDKLVDEDNNLSDVALFDFTLLDIAGGGGAFDCEITEAGFRTGVYDFSDVKEMYLARFVDLDIDVPVNGTVFSPETMEGNNSNVWINGTFTTPNTTCQVNDSRFDPGDNATYNFTFINNTALGTDVYHINISCYNATDSTMLDNESVVFEIDYGIFGLDNCSYYETHAIDFTLLNESDDSFVYGDVEGEVYYEYFGYGDIYSFTISGQKNFSLCFKPSYASLIGNYSLRYSADGFPERRLTETAAIFDNITQNITLYLLEDTEGIYVRFYVVDQYSEVIPGVTVTMQDDSGDTVEQQTTDDAGLATFWVNPDDDYTFIFTKIGYSTVTKSIRPTYSEIYSIIMGAAEDELGHSYSVGISYDMAPDGDLNNNTAYDFIFNLTSDYWEITDCALYLYNSTGLLTSTAGTYSDTYCNALINYNTGNQTKIIMNAWYEINESINNTVTRQFTIYNYYTGQFSLKNFIDDVKNFAGAGFDDFTRMVIAFLAIAAIMFWASQKLGSAQPVTMVILLAALVWAFSYGGFLRLDYTPIPTEWLKNYIIAVLISLGAGSFLLREANI